MRAARVRAIYAHSFFSNMRALACLSYARIMRVYVPLASARICLFDDCAYMYMAGIQTSYSSGITCLI